MTYTTNNQIKLRLSKIVKAIGNGSLVLPDKGGRKNWFCYSLDIIYLTWERNLKDGFDIHVYHESYHIGTI